jgi:hypothetical protein
MKTGKTMNLGGGSIAHLIGQTNGPRQTCNCGQPVMIDENGCVDCMTHNGMLVYLLSNKRWDRCLELQRKAGKDLFVDLGKHVPASGVPFPLTMVVEEGRKLG